MATSARTKGTVQYAGEEDRIRHMAMAGWPLPGCEIRVVDLHMKDVPKDMETIGEVVIRGDNVMDGYFKEPEATEAVMSGDWLHTGDMAVWDRRELHPHRRPEEGHHRQRRREYFVHRGGEGDLRPSGGVGVRRRCRARPEMGRSAGGSRRGQERAATGTGRASGVSGRAALRDSRCRGSSNFAAQPLPKTGTGKILKRELREAYWTGKPVRVGQA